MEFMLKTGWGPSAEKLNYRDGILLVGSCFTEQVGKRLADRKFRVLLNPNGILYDPLSIAGALQSYCRFQPYTESDLFFANDRWQSWSFHSRLASADKEDCLVGMNRSLKQAHEFLENCRWLIITPGTSYSYQLVESGRPVANCHKMPARDFRKRMLTIDETVTAFDNVLYQLFHLNPGLRVLFTVSPVRHLRDGLVENNQSKARLLEAVHHLIGKFSRLYYFPAYEYVIDVLRDYRFYDADMAHPSEQAADYVFEQFLLNFVDEESRTILKELEPLLRSRRHRPFLPESEAHLEFLRRQLEEARSLSSKYPFLDLSDEIVFFGSRGK